MKNDKPERITAYEFLKVVGSLEEYSTNDDSTVLSVWHGLDDTEDESQWRWRKLSESEADESHVDNHSRPATAITKSFSIHCFKCGGFDIRLGGEGHYYTHLICRDCGNHSDRIDL